MATTKSLGQKDALDRFYTKPEVAEYCVSLIPNLKDYIVLEPSAGNGAFSDLFPLNSEAIDIAPQKDDIKQMDFFDWEYKPNSTACRLLVVGNPPFGAQASLAIKFFNHAAEYATTIAFIVPRSFRKVSVQNRLSLDFVLVKDVDLPKNSFILNGKDYDVPVCFQIWARSPIKRAKVKMKTTSDFVRFTSDSSEADFRIQRVGGNAGKVFEDKNGATSSNHYIVNTSTIPTSDLIALCRTLEYPSINDVVGPKSLPKSELIEVLEEKIKETYGIIR